MLQQLGSKQLGSGSNKTKLTRHLLHVECKKANGEPLIAKFEMKPIRSINDTFDNYFVTIEDITINKGNCIFPELLTLII